ncbi:MAG: CbiX/SirB N-terminal domain-containing protein [Elusimicrobia bacterium]|nr:CbiX/SirB N-terminal domain-containing protein [Elusimicrobiota bacterium]
MKFAPALALVLLAAPLSAASGGPARPSYGIILMAHGGDASWNAEVERLRSRVDKKVPTETALGMADPAALQAAVDRLEKRKVAGIVAVPLFVQSRSEVLDQTRYALGLADKPSEPLRIGLERMAAAMGGHAGHAGMMEHAHAFSLARVKSRVPISMSRALDDHELVGRILAERAKALSRGAGDERLVLVAHGPVDDAAVPVWKDSLTALCGMALAGGKFLDCSSALLRDDSAPEVRAAAVAELREKVARKDSSLKGRVIVLPVLIARGGIERKIPKDLAGLDYAWDGKTLMPHAGFDAWVLERAATADRTGRP